MKFDEWYESKGRESFEYGGSYTLCDLRAAWDAAIAEAEEAVYCADVSSCDAGLGAQANIHDCIQKLGSKFGE